jgi:hypothetical protein
MPEFRRKTEEYAKKFPMKTGGLQDLRTLNKEALNKGLAHMFINGQVPAEYQSFKQEFENLQAAVVAVEEPVTFS